MKVGDRVEMTQAAIDNWRSQGVRSKSTSGVVFSLLANRERFRVLRDGHKIPETFSISGWQRETSDK